MARFRFGPIDVATSSPTTSDIGARRDERDRVTELGVRVPRLVTPRRYRLAVSRIVTEWGIERVEQFAAGWPDADGVALVKLLMKADRLRLGGPVDVAQMLATTHAEARIDTKGSVRRLPA